MVKIISIHVITYNLIVIIDAECKGLQRSRKIYGLANTVVV
jgi:hypothetical protein